MSINRHFTKKYKWPISTWKGAHHYTWRTCKKIGYTIEHPPERAKFEKTDNTKCCEDVEQLWLSYSGVLDCAATSEKYLAVLTKTYCSSMIQQFHTYEMSSQKDVHKYKCKQHSLNNCPQIGNNPNAHQQNKTWCIHKLNITQQ